MYFERELRKQLTAWKRSARKPLIVKGIRQVGKTSLVMEWGKAKFTDIIRLDLINPKVNSLFDSFTDPELLIEKISDLSGKSINQNETIIVFDNIDDCPAALKYLPNFNQLHERYFIVAISSYFDVLTKDFGDDYKKSLIIKTLHPLSFKEYISKSQFAKAAYTHYANQSYIKSIKPKFYNILEQKYVQYLISGGLPEPALVYQTTKSNTELAKKKAKIRSYIESDFLRFNKGLSPKRIHEIWSCLISKPKFQGFHFSYINSHSRIREYDKSLHWLLISSLIHKVSGKHFNRYVLPDVGLYFSNENTMNLKCKERPTLDTVIKLGRMSDTMRWENGYVNISRREVQHSFQCFTSTGLKGFSIMNNSILFKIDNHDSSISPEGILRLPPFFVEDYSKFLKTAKSQLKLNEYPKKVAYDFY